MNITIIFFLGLIIALVGVIPPGLLNMNAVKISLKEGYSRGVVFSIGVCLVVCLQTYIAAVFARYLSNHPEVVDILQRVAFVIFVLIAIYFFLLAKKQVKPNIQNSIKSKYSRFFQGMFMSALNVFPIPFQAYMIVTIASFGWMELDQTSIITYVAGAATGTFVMLYIYIFFFDKIKNKKLTSQQNMNYIIGGITAIVALVTLINILKEM